MSIPLSRLRKGLVPGLGALCLLAALGLVAAPVAPPQAPALGWLTDMRHAVGQRNYKGTVAYLKDKQVESFQLFHAVNGGKEQERLVSMNSPLREVVRDAQKVACYYPETKTVFVENKPSTRSVLLDIPDDLTQLSRDYRVELKGQEYVARRLSQVVDITPLDAYRYARRIWIDTDSKLPLKFEILGEDGQAVEQMVFTSLDLDPSFAGGDLSPSMPIDQFTRQTSQRETLPLDSLHWELHDVPDGFQIVSYSHLQRPPNDRKVEHILLSDGFSSVSIYIEDQKSGPPKEHPKKIGTINAESVKIGDYLATVMGEVPAKTVEAIAHGLRHRDTEQP
ncbi:MucB/RseB C-terminal domain-containing protein [Methylomagnum ishizawai]|uniref:MucB/RseB C-terminal domain-containing protein n=1 Tax=Methylomagnum ishizawai TaxID=1760988 RepID=UPI001C322C3A|nr:MucB/RseB C-terminal domain-containing protein [Methylomagnum ishizawai]BBL76055.1 sigma-E factor regulatory protein RseB [Methylomagnum ishizawai]